MSRTFKVFILFVLVQMLFAFIYYRLYQYDNSNFFFLKDILEQQSEKIEKNINSELNEINDEIEYNIGLTELNDKQLIDGELIYNAINSLSPIELKNNSLNETIFQINDTIYDLSIENEIEFHRSGGRPSQAFGVKFLYIRVYDLKHHLFFSSKIEYETVSYYRNTPSEVKEYLLKELSEQFVLRQVELEEKLTNLETISDSLNESLEKVTRYHKDIWEYGDFLYFSITTIGNSDILPNSTLCRLIVALQMLVNVFIVGFLILRRPKKHHQPVKESGNHSRFKEFKGKLWYAIKKGLFD